MLAKVVRRCGCTAGLIMVVLVCAVAVRGAQPAPETPLYATFQNAPGDGLQSDGLGCTVNGHQYQYCGYYLVPNWRPSVLDGAFINGGGGGDIQLVPDQPLPPDRAMQFTFGALLVKGANNPPADCDPSNKVVAANKVDFRFGPKDDNGNKLGIESMAVPSEVDAAHLAAIVNFAPFGSTNLQYTLRFGSISSGTLTLRRDSDTQWTLTSLAEVPMQCYLTKKTKFTVSTTVYDIGTYFMPFALTVTKQP